MSVAADSSGCRQRKVSSFSPHFKNIPQYWKVPDGATAISEWLPANSTASVASDAGRATEQIIQTLGGFGRVSDLAKRGIVEISRRDVTSPNHPQRSSPEV